LGFTAFALVPVNVVISKFYFSGINHFSIYLFGLYEHVVVDTVHRKCWLVSSSQMFYAIFCKTYLWQ